ncbi:MAG: PQQ-binding-like beta-propeller repeat protein [Pirellulales bacterium]
MSVADESADDARPLPDTGGLVFVGFNARVAALDRETGELVWQWKCPRGSGIAALLLDGDRLIASLQGYTYCLDAASGQLIWNNPLKGMGIGTACLASARANTTPQLYAVLAEYERQRQQSQDATPG